jgi:hypothetical protein
VLVAASPAGGADEPPPSPSVGWCAVAGISYSGGSTWRFVFLFDGFALGGEPERPAGSLG